MSSRYQDDPDHRARLNKEGSPEPTRQARYGNRLYCLVWVQHDLFKIGLGSGQNTRDGAAVQSLRRSFEHQGVTPGGFVEWRAEFPQLEGAAWGDCQRLEMVVATALKQRLGARAARAVGLEWLTRGDLQLVAWKEDLTAAALDALDFSGLEPQVEWTEYAPRPTGSDPGASQRDAWRTMRNRRGQCAVKDAELTSPIERSDKMVSPTAQRLTRGSTKSNVRPTHEKRNAR